MATAHTAYRVERWSSDPSTVLLPVTQLRAGDLVFDTDGFLHPVASAEDGSAGSMWIQRRDLNYREHLSGQITVVRPAGRRGAPSGEGGA